MSIYCSYFLLLFILLYLLHYYYCHWIFDHYLCLPIILLLLYLLITLCYFRCFVRWCSTLLSLTIHQVPWSVASRPGNNQVRRQRSELTNSSARYLECLQWSMGAEGETVGSAQSDRLSIRLAPPPNILLFVLGFMWCVMLCWLLFEGSFPICLGIKFSAAVPSGPWACS